MTQLEQISFYIQTYQDTLFYSIPYFLACSFVGLFLILKRASVFGFALTELTHISFILSVFLLSLWNHDIFTIIEGKSLAGYKAAIFQLDAVFFSVTFILFLITFMMTSYIQKHFSSLESFLAILIILFAACISLLNKLVDFGDHIAKESYFTEILYTPQDWFLHYLPHIILFIIILGVFIKPIFLVGFDRNQAYILNMNLRFYDVLFFTLATGIIAIGARLLGIYLTIAMLLVPGYLALSLRRSLKTTIILTLVFSFTFSLMGFMTVFYFDNAPSEPVFITAIFTLALVIFVSSHAFKRSQGMRG